MNEHWSKIRTSVFVFVFLASAAILIKGLLGSSQSQSTRPEINFPERVELEDWQFVESSSLEAEDGTKGWQYQYETNNQSVMIESYFIWSSDGNVSRLLNIYDDVPPATAELATKYEENIGFYGFLIYEESPHIAACINPYGETTLTSQQFAQNVSQYGFQLKRIIPWLLGRQDLINRSCLFTIVTLPEDDTVNSEASTIEDYPDLEQAWQSWYEVMQKQFN